MRLPPSAKKALLCGVLVLAAALAQAAERSGAPSTSEGAGSVGVVRQAGFRIHGHVEGLYPGAMKWLHLRFRNPNPFPITVTRVRTTVRPPAGSACPARSLRVAPFSGSRRIPAAGTARARVKVRMRIHAPEACAGKRHRLFYEGRATRR